MNKQHIKGAAEKTKGAFKEALGKLVGNKELEAEGKTDKAAGAIHTAAGDAEDAAKKAAKNLADKL